MSIAGHLLECAISRANEVVDGCIRCDGDIEDRPCRRSVCTKEERISTVTELLVLYKDNKQILENRNKKEVDK